MFNPKLIAIAAVCGFILSFLSGLITGVSFGIVVLRALLSAAISLGITAGVSVIYKKFLEQTSDSFSAGSESMTPPGSVVDITLGDDDLQDDESGPGFFVDPSAQRRTGSASQIVHEQTGQDDEVKEVPSVKDDEQQLPQKKQDDVENKQAQNSVEETGTVQKKPVEKGSLDDELDELPDITALSREITSSDDEMEYGRSNSNMHVESHAEHKTQDANLMAQAIRTILTKDG